MPRPKRDLHATLEQTRVPPSTLAPSETIARILKAAGNNLYSVEFPSGKTALVELLEKFRSTIFIKRNSYVVVDTTALAERENKLGGEIVNVVGDEKEWRKMGYWPQEFQKKDMFPDDSEEEESTVGKMPPTDSDED
ncbi:nucleic acid-binding protein [Sporormia fimetaria CBS 119925]|uniref:Nucleic acid-binding protein n=1 Tax=Sporormia fimetaria CBS 119925 TaxID=1340428 RepID=A0A6A6VL86_9PLEO|nr:nucleic acid-binding protein [Sporormia fimetaria CBS 119925]